MKPGYLLIGVIVALVLIAGYISFSGNISGNIIKKDQSSISQLLDAAKKETPSLTPKAANTTTSPIQALQKDPCEKVACQNSTKVCPDGFKANCKNSCLNGNCSSCEANCSGH